MVEDETYYIAILAEDVDGKLSKRIDKREVKLIASRLVFRDDVQVISVANLPVTSVMLEETEVILTLSAPVQNMSGRVLQLDEANDYAFLKLDSAVSTSSSTHRYRYSFAQAHELIRDLAFTLNEGTYDPAGALIEYYQDSAGSLDSLMAGRSGMVSVAAAGAGYLSNLLEVLLSEWTQFQSVDELYAYLVQGTTININKYKSDADSCGSLSPTFEPLDPLGWKPDPVEFNVTIKFECNISYTIKVKWNDLLRNAPELLSAEMDGAVAVSFDASGKLTQRFNLLTVDIPRKLQLATTKVIKLGAFPIPYTIALNVKGNLQGEAFGEITGSFSTGVVVGVNSGVQYTPSGGFNVLPNKRDLYLENSSPNDAKGLISQIDLSGKVGVELKSRVGPEIILSLINIAPAYKWGFNGVATLSSHVGPSLAYSIETEENPSVVVENLGALPFGIGTYEWIGSWGGDYELALHYPLAAKREFSFDPISIKFLHLPAFDVEYKDKQVGSREFEVAAVNSHFVQLNDADLLRQETRWHVIEPSDATLTPFGVDNMQAQGRWVDDYDGDAVIVFEYTPDTLASMVAGLSEMSKPIAKQYSVLVPGFLLEGKWSFDVLEFGSYFDFVTSWAQNLTRCPTLEYPIGWGTTTFSYDAVNHSYWVQEMSQTMRAILYEPNVLGSGCVEKITHSVLDEPAIFTNRSVERIMSSDELNRSFVGSSPVGAELFNRADPAIAYLLASGKLKVVNRIELLGPDQFIINAVAALEGVTFVRTRVKFTRLDRN